MSINDWFKQRESRRYTVSTAARSDSVPDGVWRKCPECKRTLYEGELSRTQSVCPQCGHHFELTAQERIEGLVDENSFAEMYASLSTGDPLHFSAGKTYKASLDSAQAATGLTEAVVVGRASIAGMPVVIAALDFRFIGASMGSVVGEKIARAFECALHEHRAAIVIVTSGGARMQEGMLSLMQMAKTTAAAERLGLAGIPYVSILTNPTYGGVTASFAVRADVIFAEPGAFIGFAGPRLVEQTVRHSLPKGFQSATSLVEHGMIDAVIPRVELRERVSCVLSYLMPDDGAPGGER